MSKKLRIILIANSVPLPVTDFLKYKLFGLSKIFDVHMLCWGKNSTRQAFYNKYADKLGNENIHLFYDKLNTSTAIPLLFKNLFRIFFKPTISLPLVSKMIQLYGWDFRKVFVRFTLYFPIAELKPEIVHFEFGTIAKKFDDLKKFINCKTTVSFRGYDINYVGLTDEHYYDEVWSGCDGFHFLGNDLKNRAVKRGYIPVKMEALIPPAIDTALFKPIANKKTNNKMVIISVGRLTWKKGYEYGLQAVAVLKDKDMLVEYRIIGTGDHLPPILYAIKQLGLEDTVVLLGELPPDAIKNELDKADVFLHPAVSEGFSNAVLEAQAMALPVVTTNADGLAENVVGGVTGFVVPIFDANALAEKLEWCYENKDALKAMGAAGVERVQTHFRIEEQITKFEAFYKQVSGA